MPIQITEIKLLVVSGGINRHIFEVTWVTAMRDILGTRTVKHLIGSLMVDVEGAVVASYDLAVVEVRGQAVIGLDVDKIPRGDAITNTEDPSSFLRGLGCNDDVV